MIYVNTDTKKIELDFPISISRLYSDVKEMWARIRFMRYDFPFIMIHQNSFELINGWSIKNEYYLTNAGWLERDEKGKINVRYANFRFIGETKDIKKICDIDNGYHVKSTFGTNLNMRITSNSKAKFDFYNRQGNRGFYRLDVPLIPYSYFVPVSVNTYVEVRDKRKSNGMLDDELFQI